MGLLEADEVNTARLTVCHTGAGSTTPATTIPHRRRLVEVEARATTRAQGYSRRHRRAFISRLLARTFYIF